MPGGPSVRVVDYLSPGEGPLSGGQVTKAVADRKCEISLWKEGDISGLSVRAKKRYNKRKSAIEDYFTTDASVEEISLRYHISEESLRKLIKKCLMRHEDGTLWGFRALLPGVRVVNYTSESTSTRGAINRAPPEEIPEGPGEIGDQSTRGTIDLAPPEEPFTGDAGDHKGPHPTPLHSGPYGLLGDDVPTEDTPVEEAPESPTKMEDQIPPVLSDEGVVPELPPTEEVEEVEPPSVTLKIVPATQMVVLAGGQRPTQPSPTRSLQIPHANGKATLPLLRSAQASPLQIRKLIQQRRLVRKRWLRGLEDQRKQKTGRRLLGLVIVLGLLVAIGVPLGTMAAAYSAYSNVRGLVLDGANHLLDVKNLLAASKSDPVALLDTKKLEQAQSDFGQAESDFMQLQQLVNRPDMESALQQFAPEYSNSLGMAKRLVQVGLDISRMGSELSGVGMIGAKIIHGSPLATGSTKPLITVTDIAAMEGAVTHALYYIDDIRLEMSQVSLKDLPISPTQRKQLTAALSLLPQVHDFIVQNQGLVQALSWLLGVGQTRRFLVQTMDRAELRPGGGFTGQYGILQIENGRMAPFTLRDVALLDYAENGVELNRPPPPEYKWMNFGNWGLRDSNLSGDYPTTARLNMQVFQEEGGGPIDGVIAFTTTFIGHILDITGPIKVQEYGETITSKNLEERLHYYQQDFSAIQLQKEKTGDNSHAVRKAFTGLLGKLLLDRVRHLPVKQLINIAKGAVKDLQSRDLEIYFANPVAEDWLVEHGFSGAMDSFKNQDGFMVVQANVSISKASQYVHTTLHDDITLDAQGGATHTLTITLDYKPTGPIYGFDAYKDYIRVYAPETAQFLSGDGFDIGQALCTPASPGGGKGGKGGKGEKGGNGGGTGVQGGTTGCGQYKTSFPSDARYCPSGNYDLGTGFVPGQGFRPLPIDQLGPPTALTSDLPGRSMWGGLTVTPKNCTSYITLSWYVPNAVKKVAGKPSYQILVQKQSGYVPTVELNIDTSAIKGLKPFKYSGDVVADRLFVVPVKK